MLRFGAAILLKEFGGLLSGAGVSCRNFQRSCRLLRPRREWKAARMVVAIRLAPADQMQSAEYASEADLLAACRRQDIRAFEQLYHMHGGRLKPIAFHIVGNRQDSCQRLRNSRSRRYGVMPSAPDSAGSSRQLLSDHPVVFRMTPNPEPEKPIGHFNADDSMV